MPKIENKLIIAIFFILCTSHASFGDDSSMEANSDGNCLMIDDRNASETSDRNVEASKLWPNGIVYYRIESGFSSSQRNIIAQGMNLITSGTCIRFRRRTTQRAYVSIRTGSTGCGAYLGYRAGTVRPIHLQQPIPRRGTCIVPGIVAHELLHSLGFAHEHTRPDRDSYVSINWSRLPSSNIAGNFFKYYQSGDPSKICSRSAPTGTQFNDCTTGIRSSTYGLRYDYGSIMHYRLNAFGIRRSQVIVPLQSTGGVRIGQNSRLSTLDVAKVNAAYGCSQVAPRPPVRSPTTRPPVTTTTTPPPPPRPRPTCRDRISSCPRYRPWCWHPVIRHYCPRTCRRC